ncbi:MAG: hypothetical protein U5K38_06650 [Woeseiaceae bacterium]|nr:hypothetical protein [Woeseiaceae bacterium]
MSGVCGASSGFRFWLDGTCASIGPPLFVVSKQTLAPAVLKAFDFKKRSQSRRIRIGKIVITSSFQSEGIWSAIEKIFLESAPNFPIQNAKNSGFSDSVCLVVRVWSIPIQIQASAAERSDSCFPVSNETQQQKNAGGGEGSKKGSQFGMISGSMLLEALSQPLRRSVV